MVALAGLIGAGRTELARAIFGITKTTGGTLKLGGELVTIRSPRHARTLGVALVPEDRQHDGLLMTQDISFNTTLAYLQNLLRLGWLSRGTLAIATEGYTQRLNLVHRSLDQKAMELSGGNQQKVVLAKWLMTEPRLLILDEPTRGVDVGAKHEVHKLIREQADNGVAVLMISSDLLEVLSLSDRIIVMREGRTVAELDTKSATEQDIIMAAAGSMS